MVLPAGCPRSVGFIARNRWTKSQSLRCSSELGAVVTNDRCIIYMLLTTCERNIRLVMDYFKLHINANFLFLKEAALKLGLF